MVDIESNGTNPATASILQIAAVKFNWQTGDVDARFFDRCLAPVPGRGWDTATRQWWSQQKAGVLASIEARAEDPRTVMVDFQRWLLNEWPDTPGGLRFWAKPITFDYCFVGEYFRIFNLDNPCHYRMARDMNSFMSAQFGNPQHPEFPLGEPDFEGDEHNALYDVIHQIKMVQAAKAQTISGHVMP